MRYDKQRKGMKARSGLDRGGHGKKGPGIQVQRMRLPEPYLVGEVPVLPGVGLPCGDDLSSGPVKPGLKAKPSFIPDIALPRRFASGIGEFDRVLGEASYPGR